MDQVQSLYAEIEIVLENYKILQNKYSALEKHNKDLMENFNELRTMHSGTNDELRRVMQENNRLRNEISRLVSDFESLKSI